MIDLDRADQADVPERCRTLDVSAGPALVLSYPAATKIEADVWSGPLTRNAVTALVDSPLRVEVATRLHKGETVWLLLECGQRAADEAAAKQVEANLPAVPAWLLMSSSCLRGPLRLGTGRRQLVCRCDELGGHHGSVRA